MKRRRFVSLASAPLMLPAFAAAADKDLKRPLGVCDWTMKLRHDLAAFKTAKDFGLEGVQVSFGEPDSAIDLRKPADREKLFAAATESGMAIASLGMGVLNQRPYASDVDAETWVRDAIDVIAAMKKESPKQAPSVVLLAFFGKGDVNGKPAALQAVIDRLKKIAPAAEDAGVVFGIESLLSREDHMKILDGVGSPSVQVYYDTANSNRMGYDIYKEVRELGAERICQIHCKENGKLIGDGVIDFPKFKASLDAIDYDGWLILEGSRRKGKALEEDYRGNTAALKRFFG